MQVIVPVIMVLDQTMQRVQRLDKQEDGASYEGKCVFDEDLLSARNPGNLCFCWSAVKFVHISSMLSGMHYLRYKLYGIIARQDDTFGVSMAQLGNI